MTDEQTTWTPQPWSGGFGVELRPVLDSRLSDVEPSELKSMILEHGLVLLRGFEVSLDQILDLTRALYDRPMVYGGSRDKVSDDDSIQTVDLGLDDLGLHVELGYVPVRPDLCVFHCVVPASAGGETTVGDGAQIFDALEPQTQQLLTDRQAKFSNLVRNAAWQRMFKIDSPELILEIANNMPATTAWFNDEGDLHVECLTTPVVERRGREVFADSLHRFGAEMDDVWAGGLKKTWTSLADGPLDDAVRSELLSVCDDLERPIGWQAGDVLLLDNWSVLHGRTAFTDPKRKIIASFGYAEWAHPVDPEPLADG